MTYAIRCDEGFFAGDLYGRDKPYLLRQCLPCETPREPPLLLFATHAEAQRFAALLDAAVDSYRLDHNQHSRPSYEVEPYNRKTATNPVTVERAVVLWGLNYDDFTGREIPVAQWIAQQERAA